MKKHTIKSVNPIQLENHSKEESEVLHKQWFKGLYYFLLERTNNHFHKDKTNKRRSKIETTTQLELPLISDTILLWLYEKAITKHKNFCNNRYENSGYQDTPSEKVFKQTLEAIISSDPKYKHLEVYPSVNYSKDIKPNEKMTIGVFVPDFIIFGIKRQGCTSVCFEINGDAHVYKYSKDLQKEKKLEELGVATLPIPNNKVNDKKYITSVLNAWLKQKSGPLDKQILRNKRKIWTKTISCMFQIDEIESMVKKHFSVNLHLKSESTELIKLIDCPRKIKSEIIKNSL